MPQRRRIWRMKRYWLLLFVLILVAAVGLAYTNRGAIAENVAERWCKSKGLTCRFDVAALTPQKVVLENVRISSPAKTDIVTLNRLALDMQWPQAFKPTITTAALTSPRLQGAFDGQRMSLYGLERVFTSDGGGGDAALPELRVTEGHIRLATPAGDLSGTFNADGNWPENMNIEAAIAPANLRSDPYMLDLQAANLNVVTRQGQVSGDVDFELPVLAFEGTDMRGIRLSAQFENEDAPTANLTVAIERLTGFNGVEANMARGEGTLILTDLPTSAQGLGPDLVQAVTLVGKADGFAFQGAGSGKTDFDLSVTRTDDQQLAIMADIDAETLRHPAIGAQNTSIRFDGTYQTGLGRLRGAGDIVANDATLKPNMRSAILGQIEPSNPHLVDLKTQLDIALQAFTTGGAYQVEFETPDSWQLIAPEKIALRSASGLRLLLSPPREQAPLIINNGQIDFTGVLTSEGGGLPKLRADIKSLQIQPDGIALQTGGLTLAPWQSGARTIAAKLNRLNLTQSGQTMRLGTLGEITLKGRFLGVEIGETRVFGGIEAANGREGWRVQTAQTPCIGVELGGLATGSDIKLEATGLTICPEDQRFIRQSDGRPTGRVTLGDVSLPFRGRNVGGRASLSRVALDWTYDDQLKLDFTAGDINLPMTLGGRSLNIAMQRPKANVQLSDAVAMQIVFDDTAIDGQLVPANVTIGSGRFEGRLLSAGFTGQAQTTDVRISDINADPYYRPLLSTLNATFDDTRMSLSGPVRLSATGLRVAQIGLNMDLLSLDGAGYVQTETLEFRPRGLQPKDLSDRFRGFLSNGRGNLTARADFLIDAGQLSGTGKIDARDFGFDTFRIGPVDGVNGTIIFSDLLGLTTLPNQTVNIAALNPGVPLNDGVLQFQILGGSQANIESAVWPFAGGQLSVLPSNWTIAGTRDIVTVEAREIDLASLIETLSLPDLVAEGTVSGTFPIELQNGNAFVRNARLVADQKGGVIRYTGEALPNQPQSETDMAASAFKALRDLRYTVLEIGVNGNLIGDIIVSLNLLGKNPDVLGGSEFKFNIEIDSKLAQLIQSGRGVVSSDLITETAVNAVRNRNKEP